MCQETRDMDIRLVEICLFGLMSPNLGFQPPGLCETESGWTDYLGMCGSHREGWRCRGALLVTLSVILCRIQGTLNQECYHRILQRYATPSGVCYHLFFNRTTTQNTPPGCVRAIWPRRRVECCIRWPGLHNHPPQPNWDGLDELDRFQNSNMFITCSWFAGVFSILCPTIKIYIYIYFK